MKTWTEPLAVVALAAVLTLAACGLDDVGVTLDIDEEAVATVQADVEEWRTASLSSVPPSMRDRVPQAPVEQRRIDPDLDEDWIREYVRGGTERQPGSSVVLNEAETDLLLERMRAKGAAGT